ncbi:MAG: hypothetical protein R6W96_07725 [Clostridia bacterium]
MKQRPASSEGAHDWRNIREGLPIPSLSYCDQPYFLKTSDGCWLLSLTTGGGEEGWQGQRVCTMRSRDRGRTWEDIRWMEDDDAPENSYAVLLRTYFGRVYCLYNFNSANIRRIPADNPPYNDGFCTRVDSLGAYVFRYSDDHGKSWSDRHEVPVRPFDIDRNNATGGSVRFFWNVGKPLEGESHALLSIHKAGGFGEGFFTSTEGALVRVEGIMTERDVQKFSYTTLPEGDKGIRAPEHAGRISEEHSYVRLSDNSLFCVYRTVSGHPYCCYSADEGKTWTPPDMLTHGNGRPVKHPRAANFVWKLAGGRYLYWFHNHGGRDYEDRNPAWVCAGRERDTVQGKRLVFSEPEVFLYDDDPYIRISYPDLLEEGGDTYVSQTQKGIARVSRIDSMFLEKLFHLEYKDQPVGDGLVDSLEAIPPFSMRDMSKKDYPRYDTREGFTLDFVFDASSLTDGEILFENMDMEGGGVQAVFQKDGSIGFSMGDGRTGCLFHSDRHGLQKGINCVTIIVDGGPKILSFVVNGSFQDGGRDRRCGWQRFSPNLYHVQGRKDMTVSSGVRRMRIYARALMVREACINHRYERMNQI